jgi:type III pantothenate kinase
MYLTLDRGNSRLKASVFSENGKLAHSVIYPEKELQPVLDLILQYNIEHLIASTTGEYSWSISEIQVTGVSIELSHLTKMPVRLLYKTPETLGRDRIASACGAMVLFPAMNCLVVDAGTCITTDLILADGIFMGGNIAPGIRMRLQAMHEQTARLPLVEPGFPGSYLGDSTSHALQNGACLGALMEIDGLLFRAKQAYGDVSVVITGGDAGLLAGQAEYQIFVEPELVAHGLFQILSFNVQSST